MLGVFILVGKFVVDVEVVKWCYEECLCVVV